MPYTIRLKKNEEKRLLSGHGWVYANEAAKIEGKDKNGSLALVRAADGRFIGKGYINHASKILAVSYTHLSGRGRSVKLRVSRRISLRHFRRKRIWKFSERNDEKTIRLKNRGLSLIHIFLFRK